MNSKLIALKTNKYRHGSTLWVSTKKHFPIKKIFKKISIWYLVYEEYKSKYNIYGNRIINKDKAPLGKLLELIHKDFIKEKQKAFDRDSESTNLRVEILHLIAIHE